MLKRAFLLAVLCIGLLAWQPASAISLGGIRNSLVQWVLDKVSIEGVFQIEVEEVVGAEEEGTTLIGVEISDADGVWFTADELTFDFNRTRLLRGQLFIENLELVEVEIFRQPAIPEGEQIEVDLEGVDAPPEQEFYWPRSPVTAAIQALVLDGVHLHEDVLGQEIRFDATGSFRDQGDVQQAGLELSRTDAVEGVIDFAYARDFEANTLAIDLDAHEAPGGLVSHLSGLPPDVPVAISLHADGTPEAYNADFDLTLTDLIQAEGTAVIDYAGPLAVESDLTIRPGPQMPEEYAQILGEQADLVVRAHEAPDQIVEIETARIDSPYLNAAIEGTWSRATGALDADVELVADPGLAGPLEGVDFAGLSFDGHIEGTPGALAAEGSLVLDGLVTPTIGVGGAVLDIAFGQSGSGESPVSNLTADGRVEGLRIDRIGADVIGEARLELKAALQGSALALETLALDSDVLDFSASGTGDIAELEFALDYAATAPELDPILDAYGMPGTGAIEAAGSAVREAGVMTLTSTATLRDFETELAAARRLALDATIVQSAERTTFDLGGTGEALRIDEIGPDVLERADLSVTGALEGNVLVLETARLDSPVLDLAAEGRMNTATGAGQFDLTASAPELAPVAGAYGYDLAGALGAEGTVELSQGGMALVTRAELTDLAGDMSSERLTLVATIDQTLELTKFDVTAESEGVSLSLAGEELSGPVDLAVQGAMSGEVLALETARITSPVLDGTAEGRLDLGDFSGSVTYDLADARLAAIAPLLGVDAAGVLAADGSAEMAPDGALSAEGTISVADLAAMGNFVGNLSADYDLAYAEVPEGTLRLELTDSPYAPDAPTVFTLAMGGPPADWEASFELDAPNYLASSGTASVSWEDPLSVSVNAAARPGPKLPQDYAQLMGDEARLVVDAEEAEGQVRIETARLSSPVLNAEISGTYATETGATDLDISLAAEPELAAPFEGIEFAGLTLNGEVTGAPGALTADGRLVLDGFASAQAAADRAVLEIDIGQSGTVDAPVTHIGAEGTVDGLRVADIGPDIIGQARIALDASLAGDALLIETARIDSDIVQLWAEGTANTTTMAFDLDYDIAAPALGALAGAYGIEAEGAFTATGAIVSEDGALTIGTRAELANLQSPYADAERLTLRGEVAQDGDRLGFDLTGAGTGLRIAELGPETLGDAEFAARGALDGDRLALDAFSLESPVIEATAEGTVNLATGAGRLDYEVAEVALGAIAPAYDLPLTGTASASGVLGLAAETGAGAPSLVGEARLANLTHAGDAIGDLVLTHDVVLSDAPHGTLELALTSGPYAPARVATAFRLEGQRLALEGLEATGFGATAGGDLVVNLDTMAAEGGLRLTANEGPFAPAEARVQIRLQDNSLMLDDLRAEALGLAAAGDVSVNLDTMLATGAIRIDEADLAALGPVIGAPVAGRARGTLSLTAEGGQQMAALDLSVTALTAYGVTVGEARIDGRVLDALGTPRLDLALNAEGIASGDMRLARATLTATGPLSGVEIALDGRGEMNDKPLVLAAAARADLAGAATRVTVSQAQLAVGEDRIELATPLTVVSQGAALRVQDLALSLPDGGRLTGDIAMSGGSISGTLQLDAPDLSFLDRAFDVPIRSGALRVAASFDTRRGGAGADIDITGRDIVAADISGAGPVSLDATLDWNGAVLEVDARATGDFERPLVIQASVPVRATGGLPALAESGPVSADIDWAGEIGDIWALVPMAGHVVTGDATIDIGVSGDIASPTFTGGIRLADGIYQNLDLGAIVQGLSLATTIESTGSLAMRLDTVEGADANVRIEGRVGFDEQGMNLAIATRRGLIIRRDDAILRLDADLTITQAPPDGRMLVAGTIGIPEAEIRLLLDNPPGIVTLGEVRIKGQPLVFSDDAPALPIGLDIDVDAPGRIFVRGRGLDSEWGMDLHVGGTASVPRINGEIAAVRGSLDLLGREFELERGRVLFNGGPVIDPRIDVSLVRETDTITGRIIVSGSAFDPELSFSSTPALPEDEVLPRLLFGTSSQALTPAQGVQLALGLATLMNGGGGTLDGFRSALGLDTLGIEQGDEGAALEIGKQVADGVWVGTHQSLEGAGTTVGVEVEVFGNVEAYGEVETDGETSVGVQWRKDF